MNDLTQPINTSMSPIILNGDRSSDDGSGSDEEGDTSTSGLQVLTQARI